MTAVTWFSAPTEHACLLWLAERDYMESNGVWARTDSPSSHYLWIECAGGQWFVRVGGTR